MKLKIIHIQCVIQASNTVDFGSNQPIVRISVDFSIFDIVYWRESYIYVFYEAKTTAVPSNSENNL